MFQRNKEVPTCGHVDRRTQLTIIEVVNAKGLPIELNVCSVRECREVGRLYVDFRYDWIDENRAEAK